MSSPEIPASWGELIDKLTILEIKADNLTSEAALLNVRKELALLAAKAAEVLAGNGEARALKVELKSVNQTLWEVEDAIRLKEAVKAFDEGFIALARRVYRTNDERARIKRTLNTLLGSDLVEEKGYAEY